MTGSFLDHIRGGNGEGRPLLWFDALDYGASVMRGGSPFPWTNPTEFVSGYCQLQDLLGADIAPVDLHAFFAAWLQANPAAVAEMGGKKRIRYAVKRLLGMDGPRAVIRDIVAALCQPGSRPVALVLPPNKVLIHWANRQTGADVEQPVTDIDIDAVSVYLADFLRTFNGLEIAAVLMRQPTHQAINPGLLELHSPILNVCGHYRWAAGMEVIAPEEILDPEGVLAFVISDAPGANGVVLDEGFWLGEEPAAIPDGGFYYANLGADWNPERVLTRIESLKTGPAGI